MAIKSNTAAAVTTIISGRARDLRAASATLVRIPHGQTAAPSYAWVVARNKVAATSFAGSATSYFLNITATDIEVLYVVPMDPRGLYDFDWFIIK